MPASRPWRSKVRRSCRVRSRSAWTSGGRRSARRRLSSCSSGEAAAVRGETLIAGGADGSAAGSGAGSAAGTADGADGPGGPARRRPGIGRITVRSLSAGSANGLSLTGPSSAGSGVPLAVVLAQAVVLHNPFQRKTVVRVGCIHSGQRIGECVGVVRLLHGVLVDRRGRQQAAVFVE